MPRGKRNTSSTLLRALRFVSPIQKGYGTPDVQFCYISGRYVTAFNGTTIMAYPIDQDLEAKPHTKQLITALESFAGDITLAIIQDKNQLIIKDASDKRTVYVPCTNLERLPFVVGQTPFPVSPRLPISIVEVSEIVTESAQSVVASCIRLTAHEATATNGNVILQSYNGGLPDEIEIYIPKEFAKVLSKIPPETVSYCYLGPFTIALQFLDGSMIGTQCFSLDEPTEVYPDVTPFVSCDNYTHRILAQGTLLKGVSIPTNSIIVFEKDSATIYKGDSPVISLKANVLWRGRYRADSYVIASKYMAMTEPHRKIGGVSVTSFMTADYLLRGAIMELGDEEGKRTA